MVKVNSKRDLTTIHFTLKERTVAVPGKIHFATFIDRPNRFLVNLQLKETGQKATAFLHDPGRLTELLKPKVTLAIRRPITKTTRKTRWDVLAVKHQTRWVTIKSSLPNHIAKIALQKGWFVEFSNYSTIKAEFSYGNSRLDFRLTNGDRPACLVEVKGVTLVKGTQALFPDAPTARGTRHLQELVHALTEGYRAAVLFMIMRIDAESIKPNTATDPVFSQQLVNAKKAGVDLLAYKVKPLLKERTLFLQFGNRVKIEV
ncbi:MAG: DNA/RNA nuclease SfsA [Candidatus Heimdallarchaeota archaeon]|nr:DNA/RNA nuclease SfsA [Candidatus Heimdallarchaeota archaeon]